MTKFLSECLEAPEPYFRQGVDHLERVNANPSNDIRLSLEVKNATKHKLSQLGLDPDDTTPEEVFYFLQEKLSADDTKLVKNLRTRAAHYVSAEAEVVAGMVEALKQVPDSKRGFAMKPACFKSIVRRLAPRKAMKQLGYRSLDSFLKHETTATIMAAAKLFETEQWHGRLYDQYKKLKVSDFEDRSIVIMQPSGARWRKLSDNYVAQNRHNIICSKELATLILLPLPADVPSGTTTASLSLALHELNDIRASSTFLKLCQVRPDFAEQVRIVCSERPSIASSVLDLSIPWHLAQRYYSRAKDLRDSFIDPHIELSDISWHPVEDSLSNIEPIFNFWRNTDHLGVLHNHSPVSLNITDAALNSCNNLKFENRLRHNFQDSLWHELLLRYMKPEVIEQSIRQTLQPELAYEMATV